MENQLTEQQRLEYKAKSEQERKKLESIVENYSNQLTRDYQLATQIRSSALSRLVWLTAISGFVIINAKTYIEAISGTTIIGVNRLLGLYAPWILTAFFAVLTHIVIDEIAARDAKFYSNKKAAIDLHGIEVKAREIDADKFSSLLRDSDPDIKRLRGDLERWFLLGRYLEMATFLLFGVAFLSLAFPLMFP